MAPVLQCPDCGTRHTLDVAGQSSSFRCTGCERVLKVPAQFRPAPVSESMAAPPSPHPNGDSSPPVPPVSRREARARAGRVPMAWRLIVWLIALPLGFAIVFGFARATGIISGRQLQDLFLDTDWGRFSPVARLLPFVALVTALIVHFGIMGLSRLRMQHATKKIAAATPSQTEVREPVRPVS